MGYLVPDLLIHRSLLTDRLGVLCSHKYQFTIGCFTGLNEVTGGLRNSLRKSIQQNLTLNPTLSVQKLPFSVSQSLESFLGKISMRLISQMQYCWLCVKELIRSRKTIFVWLSFPNIQSKDQTKSKSNILCTALNPWPEKQLLTYIGISHLSLIYTHKDPSTTYG